MFYYLNFVLPIKILFFDDSEMQPIFCVRNCLILPEFFCAKSNSKVDHKIRYFLPTEMIIITLKCTLSYRVMSRTMNETTFFFNLLIKKRFIIQS